jgi:hypothetical protein
VHSGEEQNNNGRRRNEFNAARDLRWEMAEMYCCVLLYLQFLFYFHFLYLLLPSRGFCSLSRPRSLDAFLHKEQPFGFDFGFFLELNVNSGIG